jgi:predicted NAD-dependent protein-ADP-ribosyltransferase YbiA (DUF1768 family)
MKSIIFAKAKQVPEFKSALLENKNCFMAECTTDRFWASGLSKEITPKISPLYFPGLNTLGALLMEVRDKISEGITDTEEESSNDDSLQHYYEGYDPHKTDIYE